jgi:hypothetical protein
VAVGAALAVALASFLPWSRSGEVTRSSYGLLRAAERLELLPDAYDELAAVWYSVPALVGAAWLAAALGRANLAGTLAALVGVLSLVATIVAIRSPLDLEPAALVAGTAGGVAVAAGTTQLRRTIRGRRHPSRSP